MGVQRGDGGGGGGAPARRDECGSAPEWDACSVGLRVPWGRGVGCACRGAQCACAVGVCVCGGKKVCAPGSVEVCAVGYRAPVWRGKGTSLLWVRGARAMGCWMCMRWVEGWVEWSTGGCAVGHSLCL